MKTKILSIVALLLTVTQGAWAQLGRVLATDGKYYKTVTAATNAGTTASGMIVYWGDGDTSDNTYNQGLAIALSDVVNNGQWGVIEDVTGITDTGPNAASSMVDLRGIANTNALVSKWPTGTYSYAANHCASMSTARPSLSSNWFLPSQGQFVLMMNSYDDADYGTLTSYAYDNVNKGAVVTAINNALTNAGGTALSKGRYWTSTEIKINCAGDWSAFNSSFGYNDKPLAQNVRAMFAFSGATAAEYTVSYNANGGSGAPSAQTKDGGIDLTLSSTQPTRDGYTFAGWATSADGAVAYSAGGSYTTNDDIVLYAKWTTTYTSYTVTGGSGSNWSGSEHDKLLDNNTGTKWCTVFGDDGSTATATCGEWVEFNTPHAIIPTGYILTTAEDTDYHSGRNPKSWTLKGKLNAGDAWTVLTDVTNASMPKANHTNVNFDISNTDRAYKYFRFEINAIDGSTYNIEANPQAYKFQLSRLLLKGTDAMFDASFATGSGGTDWSISPTSATDGTTVTVSYTGVHKVKSVTVAPKGLLTGKFSVSSTNQVQFSKGNLQAVFASAGTSCTWQFADHQYDYVGNTAANTAINGNGSVSAAGVVDHFGFSTSANYYGINPSADTNSWLGDFVDWGQNTITNGSAGWRTLTKDEWGYLFTDRANASTLRTFATVNNVKGLIVMPDGWTASGVSLTITTADYTTNNLSTSQWATLEKQGCVFLPIAGYRDGTTVKDVGTRGCYSSSTAYDANHAYYANFGTGGGVQPQIFGNRRFGLSVRLVHEVATVTTVPTATTGDILAGSTTALVSAGVPYGGTMMYAVTTANTKPTTTEGFSETVPTAQTCTAGTYYVWYYVKADGLHTSSDIAGSVSVTVKDPTLANVFTNGAVVVVKFNTEDSNWCGVTGTYEAGTSTFTTTGSGTLNPTSVSMTKNGDNLVVSVTSSYNTMTVTFNTTTNKYTLVDVTEYSYPSRMTSLNSITVCGTDITSTLTEYVPVPSTVTWDFSAMPEHEVDQDLDLTNGYTNDGVTLQGEDCTLNFHSGVLRLDKGYNPCTFTAPSGKKFTSIVINYEENGHVNLAGGFKVTSETAKSWSGKTATFHTTGTTDRVTSIVFTLVGE